MFTNVLHQIFPHLRDIISLYVEVIQMFSLSPSADDLQ